MNKRRPQLLGQHTFSGDDERAPIDRDIYAIGIDAWQCEENQNFSIRLKHIDGRLPKRTVDVVMQGKKLLMEFAEREKAGQLLQTTSSF